LHTDEEKRMPANTEALAATVAITSALAAVMLAVLVALMPSSRAGGPPAMCAEWTDGCVVCRRTDQGAACSTPGIACTRGPIECLKP
jgi:hypothetical protein